jgi:hypothetical protein
MGLLEFIKLSCYDNTGKASSGRISSYFLLGSILLSNATFITVDLANLVHTLAIKGQTYEIPGAHLGLYGMTLAHHLALLGIRMNSKSEPSGTNTVSTE